MTSEAGVPHPDASLCCVIVRLEGPAKLMLWNSSRSGIVYGHPAFQEIRPTLIQFVSHFSSLSRRLKDDWDGNVFRYDDGQVEEIDATEVLSGQRLVLPPLPRTHKPRAEKYKSLNKAQLEQKPWTLGLIESLAAVDIIERQRLETKNRIALILLDSNFEISLKEFRVHRQDLFPPTQYPDSMIQKLFSRRHDVVGLILEKLPSLKPLTETASHYYNIRNKLIHESATNEPTDSDIANYRATIERLLSQLFDLRFSE